MKRMLLFSILMLFFVSSLFASSIDYRGNQSADYNRTFVRNAALDSADIVNYNPAGTAFMKDGIHISVANQFVFKDYTATLVPYDRDFTADNPTLFLPSVYGVYKKDRLALFGGIHVPAGGGKLKYDNGLPMTTLISPSTVQMVTNAGIGATNAHQNSWMEASSMYVGITAGGAFAFTKQISVSLSARILVPKKTFLGQVDVIAEGGVANGMAVTNYKLDAESAAFGIGGIIGIDIKPLEKLNIGLRYETRTKLDFETTVNDNKDLRGMFVDGSKAKKDLPGLLAIGVSFDATSKLKASAAFMYFFIKGADGDDYDGYDNGWDLSFGLEFAVSSKLVLSAGYLYSKVGGSSDTYSDLDYSLDSNNFCVGVKYAATSFMDVSLAAVLSLYKTGDGLLSGVVPEEFNKQVLTLALGLNFKL